MRSKISETSSPNLCSVSPQSGQASSFGGAFCGSTSFPTAVASLFSRNPANFECLRWSLPETQFVPRVLVAPRHISASHPPSNLHPIGLYESPANLRSAIPPNGTSPVSNKIHPAGSGVATGTSPKSRLPGVVLRESAREMLANPNKLTDRSENSCGGV